MIWIFTCLLILWLVTFRHFKPSYFQLQMNAYSDADLACFGKRIGDCWLTFSCFLWKIEGPISSVSVRYSLCSWFCASLRVLSWSFHSSKLEMELLFAGSCEKNLPSFVLSGDENFRLVILVILVVFMQ